MITKNNARKLAKEYRKNLSFDTICQKSRIICDTIAQTSEFKNADTIYMYMSINNEVSLMPLFEKAGAMKKNIAIPKVKGKQMFFYSVKSLDELKEGYMGILEPDEACTESICQDGLIIMPGLAFDKRCNRAGYGGGYYDRFLSDNGESRFYKIGVAFEGQMFEEIQVQEFDISADMVVTEKNIYLRED